VQQARIEALQGMPIFGGIRRELLGVLVDASKIMTVPSGQYFFRENDKTDAMFVLEAGEVSIKKHGTTSSTR
jgi:CRP/FNR family cyclic AMP-dependent transcriptional regulator